MKAAPYVTNMASYSRPTRVILASQSPLVTAGLEGLLGANSDIDIIAVTHDSDGLRATLAQQPTDVLVVDTELADSLGPKSPSTRVLLMSPRDHVGNKTSPVASCGFVSERSPIAEIRSALDVILTCDGQSAQAHRSSCIRCPLNHSLEPSELPLSNRELQIFTLLGEGYGTTALAAHLKRSVKTIEAHRENIKRKLGLNNASDLIDAARRWVRGEHLQVASKAPNTALRRCSR